MGQYRIGTDQFRVETEGWLIPHCHRLNKAIFELGIFSNISISRFFSYGEQLGQRITKEQLKSMINTKNATRVSLDEGHKILENSTRYIASIQRKATETS